MTRDAGSARAGDGARRPGDAPAPSLPCRVDVLGLPVTAATPAIVLDAVGDLVDARTPGFVTFTGVHGVMASRDDADVRAAHDAAAIVACDGMPLVWSCRRAGVTGAERVYGPDFVLAAAERAAARGWRLFLYGGAPGVAPALGRRLADRFPGLAVAGTHTPPFRPLTPEEDAAVVAEITGADPDLVLVGLSTPKQERWMAAHVGRVPGVLLGVGAAFDFLTGRRRQAPRWMGRLGLEWAFRLATEPRRLAGRYLRNNPRFVAASLRHRPSVIDPGKRT